MPARPTSVALDAESQRKLAANLFNYVWTLLENTDRTLAETDRMIHAAHASTFFWEEVGEPVNRARGEWQISRVYATVGRPEPALHHAARCLAICRGNEIGGFDLGYAYEAMARANGLGGDRGAAGEYARLAGEAAAEVEDQEDRELLLSDLATLPG
jgi:hypothetical protein